MPLPAVQWNVLFTVGRLAPTQSETAVHQEPKNPTSESFLRNGHFFITVFSTYHLEFDLDTQTLLLDSSHSCGESLPHTGGSSQGELGASLQTCDGP